MCPHEAGRRPLLKAVAGGALALGVAGTAARIALDHAANTTDPPSGGSGALQLSADAGSGMEALDIELGDALLPEVSPGRWRSAHLPTTTHSMVAFTWTDVSAAPRIQIRSRRGGTWQPWQRVHVLHDVPDPDSGEGRGLTGTDLAWIGDCDGIQIHVEGRRPDRLSLVLLHPARRSTDAVDDRDQLARRATSRVAMPVPVPAMLSRTRWGADESWRDGGPRYNDTIQQVHVHHTVNSNTYARDDVPALIRGMYRYHTYNLGWSDIAYNFLVDRFGRVWVGRYGGPARPVRGAHTLGFNATSAGISVIGNFDLVTPSTATLDAIAGVAAWKLDLYGRRPGAHANVASEGSDKFRASEVVKLPVIDGHRDTNDTACPGQHLYDALPSIRAKAVALVEKYHSVVTSVTFTTPATITGLPTLGSVLTVVPGTFTPTDATVSYTWLRDDIEVPGAIAATYPCAGPDVGTQLSVRVELTKPGAAPATQVAAAAGLVTAAPTLAVTTTGRKGRAVVHVVVVPPTGVTATPTGEITITVNKRTQTHSLVDGAAVGRFGAAKPYPAGDFPVVVAYVGDLAFTAAGSTASVTIR